MSVKNNQLHQSINTISMVKANATSKPTRGEKGLHCQRLPRPSDEHDP
jgi:hypothetical protein